MQTWKITGVTAFNYLISNGEQVVGTAHRGDADHLASVLNGYEKKIEDLEEIIRKHNLCHDLHGKVGVDEFSQGCINEITKEYGHCPLVFKGT